MVVGDEVSCDKGKEEERMTKKGGGRGREREGRERGREREGRE